LKNRRFLKIRVIKTRGGTERGKRPQGEGGSLLKGLLLVKRKQRKRRDDVVSQDLERKSQTTENRAGRKERQAEEKVW